MTKTMTWVLEPYTCLDGLTPLHMMEIGICICWPRLLYLSLKMSIKVVIILDMKLLDIISLHVVACGLGPTQFVA